MEPKEMMNASAETLKKVLQEAEHELRTLRSDISAHQLSQVRKVRETRHLIARLKTFLQQKTKV